MKEMIIVISGDVANEDAAKAKVVALRQLLEPYGLSVDYCELWLRAEPTPEQRREAASRWN